MSKATNPLQTIGYPSVIACVEESADQALRLRIQRYIARRGQGAIVDLCDKAKISRQHLLRIRRGAALGRRGYEGLIAALDTLENSPPASEDATVTPTGAHEDPANYPEINPGVIEPITCRLERLVDTLRDPTIPQFDKIYDLTYDIHFIARRMDQILAAANQESQSDA